MEKYMIASHRKNAFNIQTDTEQKIENSTQEKSIFQNKQIYDVLVFFF